MIGRPGIFGGALVVRLGLALGGTGSLGLASGLTFGGGFAGTFGTAAKGGGGGAGNEACGDDVPEGSEACCGLGGGGGTLSVGNPFPFGIGGNCCSIGSAHMDLPGAGGGGRFLPTTSDAKGSAPCVFRAIA